MSKGKYSTSVLPVGKLRRLPHRLERSDGTFGTRRGARTKSAADFVQRAAKVSGRFAYDYRLNKELEKLSPEIDRKLCDENGGVVIIRVADQVQRKPYPPGSGVTYDVKVAGSGRTIEEAENDMFDHKGKVHKGPARGHESKYKYLVISKDDNPSICNTENAFDTLSDALEAVCKPDEYTPSSPNASVVPGLHERLQGNVSPTVKAVWKPDSSPNARVGPSWLEGLQDNEISPAANTPDWLVNLSRKSDFPPTPTTLHDDDHLPDFLKGRDFSDGGDFSNAPPIGNPFWEK